MLAPWKVFRNFPRIFTHDRFVVFGYIIADSVVEQEHCVIKVSSNLIGSKVFQPYNKSFTHLGDSEFRKTLTVFLEDGETFIVCPKQMIINIKPSSIVGARLPMDDKEAVKKKEEKKSNLSLLLCRRTKF